MHLFRFLILCTVWLIGNRSLIIAQPNATNPQTSDVHHLITQYEADYGSL